MKKIICLSFIIILSFICVNLISFQEKNYIEKSSIAFFLESEDGTYNPTSENEFPSEGYTLNTEKSVCENGSVISQNENGKINILSSKSDSCNLYFDMRETVNVADIIKSKAQSGTVTFNDISPNSLGTFTDYEFPFDGIEYTVDLEDYPYFTYSSSYVMDESTGNFSLVNPSVGTYSSIYSNLIGKYVVSYYGSSSSSIATYENLTTIYKIIDATSTTITYKESYSVELYDDENMVYSVADDYGTSYYYRGAVKDNYLKFAGFYWRILRLNGDGSLRIVYDGTEPHENGSLSMERHIGTHPYNPASDDNAYVGYMYGTLNATNYTSAHTNTKSSSAKTYLEDWYKTNIYDKGFDNAIADAVFCNDRYIEDSANEGFGSIDDQEAMMVMYGSNDESLKCPQKNDAFTKNDTTYGNGKLSHPIGLLTKKELYFAGLSSTKNNRGNYLTRRSVVMTMSPYYSNIYIGITVNTLNRYGTITTLNAVDVDYLQVVPVINLTKEYISNMYGTGTITDPFTK